MPTNTPGPAPIREPRQRRSIQKKQRILDAAAGLFPEKGYHAVTTNEIAAHAGLSIGTLYAYFAGKQAILLTLLAQLDARFFSAFDFLDDPAAATLFWADARAWLRAIIGGLTAAQAPDKAILREMEALRHSIPEVEAALGKQAARLRMGTLLTLHKYRDHIHCPDPEATATLLADFTGALVARLLWEEDPRAAQRLLDAGTEALYRIIHLKSPQKGKP